MVSQNKYVDDVRNVFHNYVSVNVTGTLVNQLVFKKTLFWRLRFSDLFLSMFAHLMNFEEECLAPLSAIQRNAHTHLCTKYISRQTQIKSIHNYSNALLLAFETS